ncbi:MAG: hypothetical protein L3J53_01875 [Proteobacteria bacterium]|nr:hypothetical protein [Pseudomonadota bacterium]
MTFKVIWSKFAENQLDDFLISLILKSAVTLNDAINTTQIINMIQLRHEE